MAWESALDRLILHQIHLADQGQVRPEDVKAQLSCLIEMNPTRPESGFHLGYARVMLGIELLEPRPNDPAARWYTFGRLRGHDRRGERNCVADLLADPLQIMQLLNDPKLSAHCLPLVMRTLFWCGDLDLAVKAIGLLAESHEDAQSAVLVDAALSDLLTRLENREQGNEAESTLTILRKCVEMNCFDRLPGDVRGRYLREYSERLLRVSEFDQALRYAREAFDLPNLDVRMLTSIGATALLAELRLHGIDELVPESDRQQREAVNVWLEAAVEQPDQSAPDANFVVGVFAYEEGNYSAATVSFDAAVATYRRVSGRDKQQINRAIFFHSASLLASGNKVEASKALRLMEMALETVKPDLESFFSVHEALKEHDRVLALRFLDAVEVGRGTAPDQLLFVALEYLSLGEADSALESAERVLHIAVDLDQRIEAMRVVLTAHNMHGDRGKAQDTFREIRELLMQRGAFPELEKLLLNEEFVGQALDHIDIKCELVALYEEMEERDFEKAQLQTAIARSLKARKDGESLHQAIGILREVDIAFPELAREDLKAIEKLLELETGETTDLDQGQEVVERAAENLGHRPRILVVGGNERQRKHHPKFEDLSKEWNFDGEWLMANYSSPQKLVNTIGERLTNGIDLLVLLHWNRHETTEPALELARKHQVLARTVHYAGFTSLQVCLTDMVAKLVTEAPAPEASTPKGKKRKKAQNR